MKTLYFLRHAKSDWSNLALPDYQRPLNERGQRACLKVGRAMKRLSINPQMVLCSTATRAEETLDRVMEAGELDWPVTPESGLYGAGADRILSLIRRQPDTLDSLLLVGHNPGFQDLVIGLSGKETEHGTLDRIMRKLPTGSFAEITFDEPTFRQIGLGSGTLTRFLKPKDKTMV